MAATNAAEYKRLLKEQIIPEFHGHRWLPGIQLLRRQLGDELEFKTIMWFDLLEAVRQFAGEDYELAYVPSAAWAGLARFDD